MEPGQNDRALPRVPACPGVDRCRWLPENYFVRQPLDRVRY